VKLLEKPRVHMGVRFIDDDEEYILAHLGNNLMSLINLKTGNRWKDPVKVEEITNVTNKELQLLIEVI